MTSANWIRCDFCHEKRDTSGRYTSPANQELDRREWARDHETGNCRHANTAFSNPHPRKHLMPQFHEDPDVIEALGDGPELTEAQVEALNIIVDPENCIYPNPLNAAKNTVFYMIENLGTEPEANY